MFASEGQLKPATLFKGGDAVAGRPVMRADTALAVRHMGGALILVSITATTLLWADLANRFVWVTLLVTVGFGAIGWVDDYRKVVHRNPKGLSARMGVLPTKGLTLPLLSFGGSGIVANCIALAILLRIDYENRRLLRGFAV